jgi:hypothetical protein
LLHFVLLYHMFYMKRKNDGLPQKFSIWSIRNGQALLYHKWLLIIEARQEVRPYYFKSLLFLYITASISTIPFIKRASFIYLHWKPAAVLDQPLKQSLILFFVIPSLCAASTIDRYSLIKLPLRLNWSTDLIEGSIISVAGISQIPFLNSGSFLNFHR